MEKRLNDEHYYRKFYFEDSFHAQCMDVDLLTMEQFDRLSAQVRTVLKDDRVVKSKRFIGTGCGDSNIAAFAAKGAFYGVFGSGFVHFQPFFPAQISAWAG